MLVPVANVDGVARLVVPYAGLPKAWSVDGDWLSLAAFLIMTVGCVGAVGRHDPPIRPLGHSAARSPCPAHHRRRCCRCGGDARRSFERRRVQRCHGCRWQPFSMTSQWFSTRSTATRRSPTGASVNGRRPTVVLTDGFETLDRVEQPGFGHHRVVHGSRPVRCPVRVEDRQQRPQRRLEAAARGDRQRFRIRGLGVPTGQRSKAVRSTASDSRMPASTGTPSPSTTAATRCASTAAPAARDRVSGRRWRSTHPRMPGTASASSAPAPGSPSAPSCGGGALMATTSAVDAIDDVVRPGDGPRRMELPPRRPPGVGDHRGHTEHRGRPHRRHSMRPTPATRTSARPAS